MADRWYRDGLRFECTRCGTCCTGAPGYVWVTRNEAEALASDLGMNIIDFRLKYLRREGSRHTLIERPNGDCIFWDRQVGCTVYAARPSQCRSYPFWSENLRSRKSWEEVCDECPGAGRGRHYGFVEIERVRRGEIDAGARDPSERRSGIDAPSEPFPA